VGWVEFPFLLYNQSVIHYPKHWHRFCWLVWHKGHKKHLFPPFPSGSGFDGPLLFYGVASRMTSTAVGSFSIPLRWMSKSLLDVAPLCLRPDLNIRLGGRKTARPRNKVILEATPIAVI
jgi:hypothetical protein